MGEKPRFWIVLSILISIAAVAALVCLWDVAEARAQSQSSCTDFKTLRAALADKAHELPTNAGIMGTGQFAVTLFSTPKGETWTLVILDAKGMACVIGAGTNWSDIAPGKGDPA
jgi:hypothetical protein